MKFEQIVNHIQMSIHQRCIISMDILFFNENRCFKNLVNVPTETGKNTEIKQEQTLRTENLFSGESKDLNVYLEWMANIVNIAKIHDMRTENVIFLMYRSSLSIAKEYVMLAVNGIINLPELICKLEKYCAGVKSPDAALQEATQINFDMFIEGRLNRINDLCKMIARVCEKDRQEECFHLISILLTLSKYPFHMRSGILMASQEKIGRRSIKIDCFELHKYIVANEIVPQESFGTKPCVLSRWSRWKERVVCLCKQIKVRIRKSVCRKGADNEYSSLVECGEASTKKESDNT